ncbi:hypothetical protein M9Y10_034762 [Tritrichomonas musculus]|uniref:non-specific serine/threonine protein kinase n=1 Tax=Tritrichomonas musculus TaxID=1915356 RepID=A0ABR2KFT3_9EUKA
MNLNGFVEEKILGKGSYGFVYKALRKSDRCTYAVKVIDLRKLSRREVEDSVNEIRLMASFTSPFLIRFYEAFCEQKRLFIVTEYAKLGDLMNLIERRKARRRPLPETTIWRFLLQILEGLRVLHSCGVVHRDLKSANILLSAPDLIKIGDLGISTVLHQTQLAKTQIGTPMYIAPEVWRKKPYDQKCDMWSLGVLLYEMMTFRFPFDGNTTKELAQRICIGKYYVPNGYSSDLISVLKKLLQVNPAQRPSVDEILDLPFVKGRLNMILPFLSKDVITEFQSPRLLSTIKIPQNVNNLDLPQPSYDEKQDIVKPIDQRIHVKDSVPLNPRDITQVSTPELKIIADQDWWSPNRVDLKKSPIRKSEPQFRPLSLLTEGCDIEEKKSNSNPEENLKVCLDQPNLNKNQKKEDNKPNEADGVKNNNQKPMELNPVIPPYQGYHKHKQHQQRQSDDQRPSFMKPLFQQIPNKNKNNEYRPVYNINSPRQEIVNAPAANDPKGSKLPPIQHSPRESNMFDKPEFNEQPRKHPPVAINPRFRKIGVR